MLFKRNIILTPSGTAPSESASVNRESSPNPDSFLSTKLLTPNQPLIKFGIANRTSISKPLTSNHPATTTVTVRSEGRRRRRQSQRQRRSERKKEEARQRRELQELTQGQQAIHLREQQRQQQGQQQQQRQQQGRQQMK